MLAFRALSAGRLTGLGATRGSATGCYESNCSIKIPHHRPGARPHFSPAFVARASRRRGDGAHGLNDAAGVVVTTSKRREGVRPVNASGSAAAAEGWVESTTGAVAVGGRGGSRSRRLSPVAGASIPAMAPFPVAAHRTGRANFPHPALGRDHAFAHGRLAVRGPRCVSPYSVHSRSSGKRTHCPDRTLCLRQSHWRSRRVACRSTAA